MNQNIVDNLENLINNLLYNKPSNYSFKINSFRKTIQIIKDLDFEIKDIDSLKNIKGIGKGTLERIKEILTNGELKENKEFLTQKKNTPVSDFNDLQKITGIGPSKAKQLIEKKITLNDLINKPTESVLNELTHHQLIGVKYYNDLLKRIDNNIISDIEKYLNKFDFKFTICGSYRRKKDTSGDIDILVLKEDKSLKDIVDLLTKHKFIVDSLTTCGETKYMGICKTPKSHYMRIDIRLIAQESFPFALLYFTGSKKTNTFMRNKAIKKGYKLSEYGLFDKEGNMIKLNSEKTIFEFLELSYLPPEKR